MNPTEQKTHTRKTDSLDTRLTDAEAVLVALDERVSQVVVAFRREIGDERTHRLKLAEEQRGYVDDRDREIRRAATLLGEGLHALRDRTLWGRLRWIVRGT